LQKLNGKIEIYFKKFIAAFFQRENGEKVCFARAYS
jgi:hypothetical protein